MTAPAAKNALGTLWKIGIPMAIGVLSNINGCLTQYGIGSGPVMFGAGYVTQAEWWKAGFIMSVLYLGIWTTVGPLWWLALGHI